MVYKLILIANPEPVFGKLLQYPIEKDRGDLLKMKIIKCWDSYLLGHAFLRKD